MDKAPWSDYNGNDIYEGNIMVHPSRESGIVVCHNEREEPADKWCVRYDDGTESKLCLQISDKGKAVVESQPPQQEQPGLGGCVAECVHCGELYLCGKFNEKEWLANECLECDGPLRARIVKEYKPTP